MTKSCVVGHHSQIAKCTADDHVLPQPCMPPHVLSLTFEKGAVALVVDRRPNATVENAFQKDSGTQLARHFQTCNDLLIQVRIRSSRIYMLPAVLNMETSSCHLGQGSQSEKHLVRVESRSSPRKQTYVCKASAES
jgi:hypothetical protein